MQYLIGWPTQVVVGKRGLAEGKVEVKRRATGEKFDVSFDSLADSLSFLNRYKQTYIRFEVQLSSNTKQVRKPELLAPAGGFEQLRYALYFGADAVYLACDKFGLRQRAPEFLRLPICPVRSRWHTMPARRCM